MKVTITSTMQQGSIKEGDIGFGIGSGTIYDFEYNPIHEMTADEMERWIDTHKTLWVDDYSMKKNVLNRIKLSYSIKCYACDKRFRFKKHWKAHKLRVHVY